VLREPDALGDAILEARHGVFPGRLEGGGKGGGRELGTHQSPTWSSKLRPRTLPPQL
jgi:hypothetical protein